MSLTSAEQSTQLEGDSASGLRDYSQSDLSFNLPDEPVVVIEAAKRWVPLNLRNLWAHRELLYFLIWRDLKVRYKQTVLGAAWAIIQPLVTMVIFTYFFGILTRVPTDGVPYPIFFYTGLLLWTFLSNTISAGANSLIGNTNLITKVYFPKLVVPAAAVGAGLVDFAIAAVLLAGLLIYYDYGITLGSLLAVPVVLLTTLFALGFSVALSAINVKYRDVRYALPFLIQVWMFISPIIYPSTLVPDQWRWVLILNPLTGIIEAFRDSLLGQPFEWGALGYSACFTFVLLFASLYGFRRLERNFAEFL
jgi:lipopolysaccharide transport system permease protein